MPADTSSSGVGLSASGDASVGGDLVGRDKITTITHIHGGAQRRAELPHQPYFFGRAAELARIAEALDPEVNGWGVLIDGAGGIGKTALAIRAGHLAPDALYPIKIFLSAKQRELTPGGELRLDDFVLTSYEALLAELARELGEDEIAKGDPAERPQAVRRALAGRQALLILDNVEVFDERERERLFQFLRRLPRSCRAIVTSRRRMDVAAEVLRLDRLPPDDAQKLIGKLAERSRGLAQAAEAERRQLYELAQGNPLLIEWLAGQLGRPGSRCRTVPDTARFLAAAPAGNDPLEFIFSDVLATLADSDTAALAALSHFTHPAQLPWVAEAAGLPAPAAGTVLEDLLDRSLVQSDEAGETFLLLPLVAELVQRRFAAGVAAAAARLADGVLGLLLNGDLRDFRNYPRVPALAAEWPRIAAALPYFLQGENGRLQVLCDALHRLLYFSGQWDEWLALSLQAEARAVEAGDPVGAGWRAYHAGWVYRLRGQPEPVLDCARRAAEHWSRTERPERALAIRLRGKGHQLARAFAPARAAFEEMIAFARAAAPESELVPIGLNDLGWCAQQAGDLELAGRCYSEALLLARAIGYDEGVATNLGTLGDVQLARAAWAEAETLLRDALRLTESMGHQLFIAYNCWRLALALARQGRPAEGLPYARRAVALFTRLPSPEQAQARAALAECDAGVS
ncbi:MAG: tetratricopeptide repeat protein [Anaerolineales bacterium]|nr:tetratricopeptide repeat protein [Anaerolineales bacterium]